MSTRRALTCAGWGLFFAASLLALGAGALAEAQAPAKLHLLSQALDGEAPLSILELKGLGKARWRGVNPAAHVARERRSWD